MGDGAQRRYGEQRAAYKDIRNDLKDAAPGLLPKLDHIYRHK